jgi:DnaK suppressor protein
MKYPAPEGDRHAAFAGRSGAPPRNWGSADVLQPGSTMRSSHGHTGGTEAMMQGARRVLNERVAELRARLGGHGTSEELEEIQHALKRMDAGTWGRCEKCDGAIGRDRLRAIPETRSCLDCATR